MPTPFPEIPPANDIAGVVERIDSVVAWSSENQSRLGYFAALYKRITRAIGTACASGAFEDAPRMARLDSTFANRYFAALNGHFHPEKYPQPPQCWRVTFDAATLSHPVIVLHMLAGVNAHIALDLGVAACETAAASGEALLALRGDFFTVNNILAQQVHAVLAEIDAISPVLAALYDLFQKFEISTVNDGISLFRDSAWTFASLLALEGSPFQSPTIAMRDLEVARLGTLILNPRPTLAGIVNAVARQENQDIPKNIEALNAAPSA